MRKLKLVKVSIFFILALVTSFTGCFDLYSSVGAHNGGQSAQTFTVSGTFFVKGAVPSALASSSLTSKNTREAVPSYPGAASLYYNLTAEHSDKTNATGTVNGTSFSIKLNKTGTWNLKAEGYSDSAKAKKVFEGSTKVDLTPDEPVKNNISIELNPLKEGTGNISLQINVNSDSGINSIKAELKSASSDSTFTGDTLTFETFPATISKLGIKSGAYFLTVCFYDKTESDADKNLIYAAQETVNVFDNLTTEWWQGDSEYIDSTDGTFTVTKENVKNFARTTFFVQGANGTYTPRIAASDSNTGTYFDPYATLQRAGDRIFEINDAETTYTIYVDGNFYDSTNINCSKLQIKGLSSESKPVLENGEVIYATISDTLLLQNLKITNGNVGLNLSKADSSSSASAVINNCEITGNTKGIISGEGCELTLSGTVVVKDNDKSGIESKEVITIEFLDDGSEVNINPSDYTEGIPIVQSADGVTLTDEILYRIKIAPQTIDAVTKVYWTLRPDDTKKNGVLKKHAVNTTVNMPIDHTYKFRIYDINGVERSDFELGKSITFKLFEVSADGTEKEITLTSNSYKFALAQNGIDAISSTIVEGKPTISLSSTLKSGKYQVRISADLHGETFEVLKDVNLYTKAISTTKEMVSLTKAIKNGTEVNCGSEQTLSYGNNLISALNSWIDAQNNPNDYKRWKLNTATNLPELIY